jgi:hypothetical protein
VLNTPSFFRLLALFSIVKRFSSCICTVDVGFVKLPSKSVCVCVRACVETGSTRWILSFAVTFAAIVLLHSYLFFGHYSFLLADNVFPRFVYAVMILETVALDTSS